MVLPRRRVSLSSIITLIFGVVIGVVLEKGSQQLFAVEKRHVSSAESFASLQNEVHVIKNMLAPKQLPKKGGDSHFPELLFPNLYSCPSPIAVDPSKEEHYSQYLEDESLFKQYFQKPLRTQGTFVEIGALDGNLFSNSKFFEEALDWRGVLIEAMPENSRKLMINRKKKTANFAMAVCSEETALKEGSIRFRGSGAVGGQADLLHPDHVQNFDNVMNAYHDIKCAPMSWALSIAGVRYIDFFILDVEGAELQVLKTIDWDAISVYIWVVELNHLDDGKDGAVRSLLEAQGYENLGEIGSAPNYVFINKDYDHKAAAASMRSRWHSNGEPCALSGPSQFMSDV